MTLGMFDFRSCRAVGISDDQEREDLRAKRRLFAAMAEMRKAIKDVNDSAVLVEIEPSAFEDFLNASPADWTEQLSNPRNH